MTLKSKRVLITGAAKRLGREIALAFAQEGCEVLVHYSSSEKEALSLAQNITQLGGRVTLHSCDLTHMQERADLIKNILKTGDVDILVNNASLFYSTPLEKITGQDWFLFQEIHVHAPFFLSQALAPGMKKKKWGRIINLSCYSASNPYKEYLPYSVSKAGLVALTKALAKELSPDILVNTICPGPILPPVDKEEIDVGKTIPNTLLKRWGCPADIVSAVLYLATQNYITGSTLPVDGGKSLL